MLDFATPHSVYEPVGENRGRFVVEPLARGFGYTFGNSLRRVLLSSLEGAAISAVKITGVEHEFSTVPHVKEDVTDIILNLKKVVFVLHGEAEEHEVMLVKDGPGEVPAGDIELPATVEVMNPEAYIATIEDAGRLEMRLTVRRGRGYVSADDNKRPGTALGVIPIDSIFSPVQASGLQRGARSRGPAHRLRQADARSRDERRRRSAGGRVDGRRHAAGRPGDASSWRTSKSTGTKLRRRPSEGPQPEDDMLIDDLDLGVRSLNCLKREGVETVGDLLARSEQDLMCIPNFGRKSLDEVRERLEKNNLKLRGE